MSRCGANSGHEENRILSCDFNFTRLYRCPCSQKAVPSRRVIWPGGWYASSNRWVGERQEPAEGKGAKVENFWLQSKGGSSFDCLSAGDDVHTYDFKASLATSVCVHSISEKQRSVPPEENHTVVPTTQNIPRRLELRQLPKCLGDRTNPFVCVHSLHEEPTRRETAGCAYAAGQGTF
ncbi:unnamed protein product [Protopolystoma xenopodis]|uniref:Uncharacterized protein n=1 Tax=Protopolystoma xenopodis TaxID=117903 RepID=A0A3S5A3Z8_9PLAT|nr:unnamed protein product [Protopolystoma xenopodis]